MQKDYVTKSDLEDFKEEMRDMFFEFMDVVGKRFDKLEREVKKNSQDIKQLYQGFGRLEKEVMKNSQDINQLYQGFDKLEKEVKKNTRGLELLNEKVDRLANFQDILGADVTKLKKRFAATG